MDRDHIANALKDVNHEKQEQARSIPKEKDVEISHKLSHIKSFKENILVYKRLESPILFSLSFWDRHGFSLPYTGWKNNSNKRRKNVTEVIMIFHILLKDTVTKRSRIHLS